MKIERAKSLQSPTPPITGLNASNGGSVLYIMRQPFEMVVWMLGSAALNNFARIGMSTAGPDLMREFAFSETQLGFVYGAFAFAYAVGMIPAGWVSDKFGPRR